MEVLARVLLVTLIQGWLHALNAISVVQPAQVRQHPVNRAHQRIKELYQATHATVILGTTKRIQHSVGHVVFPV